MALNGTPASDTLSARFDGDLVYGLGGRDTLTSYGYNDTYLDGGVGNDRLISSFDLAQVPDVDEFTVVLTQAGGLGNDSLTASITGELDNDNSTDVTSRLNLTGGDGIDTITANVGPAYFNYATVSIWGGIGDDFVSVNEIGSSFTALSTLHPIIRAGDGNDQVVIHTYGDSIDVTNDVQGKVATTSSLWRP